MKAQTEAAIRNIVGLDPEVKQENIERVIRYLKGESRGGSVDSLFG